MKPFHSDPWSFAAGSRFAKDVGGAKSCLAFRGGM